MALSSSDREYVINQAVDLLRHKKRSKLLQILSERLAQGDYPDGKEQDLDEIVRALCAAIGERLDGREE